VTGFRTRKTTAGLMQEGKDARDRRDDIWILAGAGLGGAVFLAVGMMALARPTWRPFLDSGDLHYPGVLFAPVWIVCLGGTLLIGAVLRAWAMWRRK